jgi:hypothetical protein
LKALWGLFFCAFSNLFVKKVVQDLTSGGLLGVWGKWVKHAKYIRADKKTFKMYTDIFLLEYIVLAIHMNSQGNLSDTALDKVKDNANLMI